MKSQFAVGPNKSMAGLDVIGDVIPTDGEAVTDARCANVEDARENLVRAPSVVVADLVADVGLTCLDN